MKKYAFTVIAFCALVLFINPLLYTQEFGLGSPLDSASVNEGSAGLATTENVKPATSAKVGGSINYSNTSFFTGLNKASTAESINNVNAILDFSGKTGNADATFKFKISSDLFLAPTLPKLIDEAYVRVFMGPVMLQTGFLKPTWGKADSMSVLDVLNPLDLSDLSITDLHEKKIAQPMLNAQVALGMSSKLNLVFMPSFSPNSIAWNGKWMPKQIGEIKQALDISVDNLADLGNIKTALTVPNTESLYYSHGGVSFSTTIGQVDLGAQYFFGYLPDLALSPAAVKKYATEWGTQKMMEAYPSLFGVPVGYKAVRPAPLKANYNRYHQIGLDAATELLWLNWRAEAAVNITEDIKGDKSDVYNPFFAWNLGFDKDLFNTGVYLNVIGTGTVRFFDGNIKAGDLEYDTDMTKTKLAVFVSQKLFKDRFEWSLAGVWGIEKTEFFIEPKVSLLIENACIYLSAGIFGGKDTEGMLSQFKDSSYIKFGATYKF